MKKLILLALCLLLMLNGAAQASLAVRIDDGALLLDENGSVILPMDTYDDIVPLESGMFAAGISGNYGLMDTSGNLLTETMYSDLRIEGTFTAACIDDLWGLLDQSGKAKTPFAYTQIVSCGNGSFWALKGSLNDMVSDELFILTPDGNERATGLFLRSMDAESSEGLITAQFQESGLWGYCDSSGKAAIPDVFSHAGSFVCGIAPIAIDGKYGAINTQGEYILTPEYDFLEISTDGLTIACSADNARVLDASGTEIAYFEGAGVLAAAVDSGFIISDGESTRLFDKHAKLKTEFAPDASVYEGLGGRFIIAEGPWGENCVYLDGTQQKYQNIYPLGMAGEIQLYACMQANAAHYVNDLLGEIQLSVDMESARYGIIDGSGELLLPCEYESIEYLANDRLLVHADGQWQLIDSTGRIYWTHGIRQIEEPNS